MSRLFFRINSPNAVSFFLPCLIFAALLSGCKSGGAPNAVAKDAKGSGGGKGGEANTVRNVRLVPVTEQTLNQTVTATGTLAADDQASLSFRVAGRLAQLSVDLGTVVKKGQAIARLDPLDFKQRVEAADAALQQARVRDRKSVV